MEWNDDTVDQKIRGELHIMFYKNTFLAIIHRHERRGDVTLFYIWSDTELVTIILAAHCETVLIYKVLFAAGMKLGTIGFYNLNLLSALLAKYIYVCVCVCVWEHMRNLTVFFHLMNFHPNTHTAVVQHKLSWLVVMLSFRCL